MSRKKPEPDDGHTPHQRGAIAAVEHLLGLALGAPRHAGGKTFDIETRDRVIDIILDQAGLVLQKEVRHLFHAKQPPGGAS